MLTLQNAKEDLETQLAASLTANTQLHKELHRAKTDVEGLQAQNRHLGQQLRIQMESNASNSNTNKQTQDLEVEHQKLRVEIATKNTTIGHLESLISDLKREREKSASTMEALTVWGRDLQSKEKEIDLKQVEEMGSLRKVLSECVEKMGLLVEQGQKIEDRKVDFSELKNDLKDFIIITREGEDDGKGKSKDTSVQHENDLAQIKASLKTLKDVMDTLGREIKSTIANVNNDGATKGLGNTPSQMINHVNHAYSPVQSNKTVIPTHAPTSHHPKVDLESDPMAKLARMAINSVKAQAENVKAVQPQSQSQGQSQVMTSNPTTTHAKMSQVIDEAFNNWEGIGKGIEGNQSRPAQQCIATGRREDDWETPKVTPISIPARSFLPDKPVVVQSQSQSQSQTQNGEDDWGVDPTTVPTTPTPMGGASSAQGFDSGSGGGGGNPNNNASQQDFNNDAFGDRGVQIQNMTPMQLPVADKPAPQPATEEDWGTDPTTPMAATTPNHFNAPSNAPPAQPSRAEPTPSQQTISRHQPV